MLPKPEPRRRTKDRAKRQKAEARKSCREIVYNRDGGCCVICGTPLVLNPVDAPHEFAIAHIDEILKRSQGGDPTDPDNCQTLCHRCHARRHGLRVT